MDIYTVKALVEKYSNRPTPWLEFEPPKLIPNFQIDDGYDTRTSWGFMSGKHNPNYGGNITKQSWIDGHHDHVDHSASAKKGWKNRDKDVAVKKMCAGHKKWREQNPEKFAKMQKEKAQKSKMYTAKKLWYNGKVYMGYKELKEMTGISRYKYDKYYGEGN
jgi:hypothetical protein